MRVTLIHGPMACGKTTNRDLLAKTFGCDRIFDEEFPALLQTILDHEERARERRHPNAPPRPNHVLALCTTSNVCYWQEIQRQFEDWREMEIRSYDDAMEIAERRGDVRCLNHASPR